MPPPPPCGTQAHPLALPFEVAFEPPALPVTSVVSEAAALSSWGVDLLVLAAPEDAFKTEGGWVRQGGACVRPRLWTGDDGRVEGPELPGGGGSGPCCRD